MQTALFEYQLIFTFWTLFAGGCSVLNISFQSTLHTILPCVDGLRVEVQAVNELNNLVDRHAVAQYARDKLRVVPELLVEET